MSRVYRYIHAVTSNTVDCGMHMVIVYNYMEYGYTRSIANTPAVPTTAHVAAPLRPTSLPHIHHPDPTALYRRRSQT